MSQPNQPFNPAFDVAKVQASEATVSGATVLEPQRRRRWTPEQQTQIMEQWQKSGLPQRRFAREHGLDPTMFNRWVLRGRRSVTRTPRDRAEATPLAERREWVRRYREEHQTRGTSLKSFAQANGLKETRLAYWVYNPEPGARELLGSVSPPMNGPMPRPGPEGIRGGVVEVRLPTGEVLRFEANEGVERIAAIVRKVRGV